MANKNALQKQKEWLTPHCATEEDPRGFGVTAVNKPGIIVPDAELHSPRERKLREKAYNATTETEKPVVTNPVVNTPPPVIEDDLEA